MWYKRAKKKLSKWGSYNVYEKHSHLDGYELMFAESFKGSCAEHALRRALKKWHRKYCRFHDFERECFRGVTKPFGNFGVYDIEGKFFYYYE